MPFEVKSLQALSDGFEIMFTRPVEEAAASRVGAYELTSYTYTYHSGYGSPEIDGKALEILSATVSANARRVRLKVSGLREGYVHELHLRGVRAIDGRKLLHTAAYYTLNKIPLGRAAR